MAPRGQVTHPGSFRESVVEQESECRSPESQVSDLTPLLLKESLCPSRRSFGSCSRDVQGSLP